NMRAMGLVYTTLLAIVPLIAVSFSVLKGFGVHNQIEPALLNLFAPLGEKGVEITNRIIEFVDNIKVTLLGSVGLALLFYTVVSLMQKIERAFNFTWRVSEHRPFSQRFSDYLTVVLIGPVLIFTALGLTATVEKHQLVQAAMQVEVIGSLLHFVGRLIPYMLVIGAFTFIYIFVPNTKVKIRAALIGGVVAGILWESVGWGFAAFVVNSTKYTVIYSAFATLIVLLIWLYVSWLILLIGGSVAFYMQYPEQRNLQSRILRLSNRMKEKLALMIMALIGQNYYQQHEAWTLDKLAKRLKVGNEACGMMVVALEDAGLLIPTADEPPAYLPGHALETLSLQTIVDVVRESGETGYLSPEKLPAVKSVDTLYEGIESAIDSALAGRSLRDLSLPEQDEK
ncbi:MAG: YihY/virulence factor BrkB family protein, partial [Thiohalomonadales bacterium]|nr:YihY/virulence factor BrkB family protein [Thiohalomonadales bacterium]